MSLQDTLHSEHVARMRRLSPNPRPVVVIIAQPRRGPEVDEAAAWMRAEELSLRRYRPALFWKVDDYRPTIKRIQMVICAKFDIEFVDLISERRTREVVIPRQVAMYLAKTMTLNSYPEIGRRFGGRDHTTCLWAVKKTIKRMGEDPELAKTIAELSAALGGSNG